MARPGSPRPDLGVDPAYAPLKARIIARTGHHYYIDKDELLIERLHRRFRAAAVADCAAYAGLLSDGASGEAEWARLEAEITVGETFFFRYAEQFAALRTTILPALIAARTSVRTLRVWSAGCSTGAEPYSIAILLHELLGTALPDWRISILGSDISTAALETARAGLYGRWALRTLPPGERLRYFVPGPAVAGAGRDGTYALRPEFRRMVCFERRNLMDLLDLRAAPPAEFDLILCRNVLIYFEAEVVLGIVRGLGRRLTPEGWLLIGHAEPNPAIGAMLEPVNLPGTVAYRPRGAPMPVVPMPVVPAPAWVPGPVAAAGMAPGPTDPQPPVTAVAAPAGRPADLRADRAPPVAAGPDADGPAIDLARIRALADAGETAQAWRAIRAAIRAAPTDPVLHYYDGLLARSLGREVEAERAWRGALYLDRDFVMAHYQLGLLMIGLGRRAEAVRALDNAIRLAQGLTPDAVVAEGDGLGPYELARSAALARAGLKGEGP